MEHSALQSLTQKNPFMSFAMPLTTALELHSSKKIDLEKWS